MVAVILAHVLVFGPFALGAMYMAFTLLDESVRPPRRRGH